MRRMTASAWLRSVRSVRFSPWLILGLATGVNEVSSGVSALPEHGDFGAVAAAFGRGLPGYIKEVALALLPIVLLFGIFQFVFLHLPKKMLIRLGAGLVYTFVGLVFS